jgi:hypothetical protein
MKSQNQLAVFVLAAAKAHEASYDKEASDAAVKAAEEVAPQQINRPMVLASELMGRSITIDGKQQQVIKCFKDGRFRTFGEFEGVMKNVRRRGRGFVYYSDAEIAAEQPLNISAHIDFSKFQKLNIFQATCTVVPVDYQMPVYLLLQTSWNDALDWANAQVAQTEGMNYAFDLTFKPEGEKLVCVTHQIHADSELAAAFKIGQVFDDQFGADFTIERNVETYEFVESQEPSE